MKFQPGFVAATVLIPSDFTGLEAWHKADAGVTKDGGNLVSSCADQSGNGRDVTETTNKPLWVDALVNGLPAIRFDGINDKLVSGGFVVAQPLHVFIVCKQIAVTEDDRIFATTDDNSGPKLVQDSTGPSVKMFSNNTNGPMVTVDTTDFHLVHAVFNGASPKIALDNGGYTTGAQNLIGGVAKIGFGADPDAEAFGNVEIAEACLYNTEISGQNLTDLLAYFQSRYALW